MAITGSGTGSPPVSGSPEAVKTSPTAFTTASAPTVASPRRTAAEPTPALRMCSKPRHLATVAPVPAPTLPIATGCAVAAR